MKNNKWVTGVIIIVFTILLVFGFLFFILPKLNENPDAVKENIEKEPAVDEGKKLTIDYPLIDKEIEIKIDLDSFKVKGNSVVYTFTVPETGLYNLFVLSNFDNRRNKISIDSKEFEQKTFSEEYMWENLGEIGLKKGEHELKIELLSTDENLLEDPGFEDDIWNNVSDCCNGNKGKAVVSASQGKDSFEGDYSLKLESENHCACIGQQTKKIDTDKLYYLSFAYKGDTPKFCVWAHGCGICAAEAKLEATKEWKVYETLFEPKVCAKSFSQIFYSSSYDDESAVTFYDDVVLSKVVFEGIKEIMISSK